MELYPRGKLARFIEYLITHKEQSVNQLDNERRSALMVCNQMQLCFHGTPKDTATLHRINGVVAAIPVLLKHAIRIMRMAWVRSN